MHVGGRPTACAILHILLSKAPTRVRLLNVCVWPVLDSIFQIIRPVCRESHCFCIHARHAGRWSTPSKPRSQKLPRRSSKQMIMSWGWDMLYTGEMRCQSAAMWIGLAIIIYRSKTCTQSTPLKKFVIFTLSVPICTPLNTYFHILVLAAPIRRGKMPSELHQETRKAPRDSEVHSTTQ